MVVLEALGFLGMVADGRADLCDAEGREAGVDGEDSAKEKGGGGPALSLVSQRMQRSLHRNKAKAQHFFK